MSNQLGVALMVPVCLLTIVGSALLGAVPQQGQTKTLACFDLLMQAECINIRSSVYDW